MKSPAKGKKKKPQSDDSYAKLIRKAEMELMNLEKQLDKNEERVPSRIFGSKALARFSDKQSKDLPKVKVDYDAIFGDVDSRVATLKFLKLLFPPTNKFYSYLPNLQERNEGRKLVPSSIGNVEIQYKYIGGGADGAIHALNISEPKGLFKLPTIIVKSQECLESSTYYTVEVQLMKLASHFTDIGIPHFPYYYFDFIQINNRGNDACCFLMEKAVGDLSTFIEKYWDLQAVTGIGIILQTMIAINFFHEIMQHYYKGDVIHCDLHNSNMLVFKDPEASKEFHRYNLHGIKIVVPYDGMTITTYDYARSNGSHSCPLNAGYDYLRAFSDHAGLVRSFKRAQDRAHGKQTEVVAGFITICRVLVQQAAYLADLSYIRGNADWDHVRLPEGRKRRVDHDYAFKFVFHEFEKELEATMPQVFQQYKLIQNLSATKISKEFDYKGRIKMN